MRERTGERKCPLAPVGPRSPRACLGPHLPRNGSCPAWQQGPRVEAQWVRRALGLLPAYGWPPDLSGEPRRATLAALNLGPEPVAQAVAGPERTPFWTGPSAPDPSTFGRRPASSRFGASGRPKQTVGGAYIWPELTHANGIAGVSRQGRIRPLPSRRRRDRSRLGRSSGGRRGLPPDSVGGSYWRGHAVPNHGRPRG
jgi:hypothetical protein